MAGDFYVLRLDPGGDRATVTGPFTTLAKGEANAKSQPSAANVRFAVVKLEKAFTLKPSYSVEEVERLLPEKPKPA